MHKAKIFIAAIAAIELKWDRIMLEKAKTQKNGKIVLEIKL